jgi:hypothetical protein
LAGQTAGIGLADLGLRRVEGRCVKVPGRVLLEGVDVDGAPCVAERGLLLDDGHGGRDDVAGSLRRGRWGETTGLIDAIVGVSSEFALVFLGVE